MKTKAILFSLFLAVMAFTFTNCGSKKEHDSHDHASGEEHAGQDATSSVAEAAAPQFTVDAVFQQQLGNVFKSYVALKDAFVASDAGKVKAEAEATETVLAAADMKLLTGAAHNDWMAYLGKMKAALDEIQSATDIEVQRRAFSELSDSFYKSIKAFGLGGSTAYYEYCPMAFDNEGAYWLSDAELIRNPYFGDKMLNCGTVQEKLQ